MLRLTWGKRNRAGIDADEFRKCRGLSGWTWAATRVVARIAPKLRRWVWIHCESGNRVGGKKNSRGPGDLSSRKGWNVEGFLAGAHTDTLDGLKELAFGFDAGRDDDLGFLELADGAGTDV